MVNFQRKLKNVGKSLSSTDVASGGGECTVSPRVWTMAWPRPCVSTWFSFSANLGVLTICFLLDNTNLEVLYGDSNTAHKLL